MKIKLASIRSNFNLNPFPDRARAASYASRKDFDVYRFYRGQNSEQRLTSEPKKKEKIEFFKKVSFSAKNCLNSVLKFILIVYLYLQ